MESQEAQASFTEIRPLLEALPDEDAAAAAAIAARLEEGTGKSDGADFFDALLAWMAGWQGRGAPRLDRPRAAVFLGRYGSGDAAYPDERLRRFVDGEARVAALCRQFDAELRVFDMATGADDDPAALTEAGCATAMAYGMTAVDDGLDLLCVAASGPGVEAAAASLARDVAGGTGGDPLDALRRQGGHALAAVAGAVLAARMGRVPVVIDGFAATAAAAVLQAMTASVLDHCLIARVETGTPHRDLLDRLGKEPLIDLGMPLEEGCGALLSLAALRAALACVNS